MRFSEIILICSLVFASSAFAESPGKSCDESNIPKNAAAVDEHAEIPDASVDQLKEAFNAASSEVRVVSVLSPTCPMCQKGHSAVKSIFSDLKSDKLRGFLVWIPMKQKDDAHMAFAQSSELKDKRVVFEGWDGKKDIGEKFSQTLGLKETAWDIYLVYEPGVKWTDANPPKPTFWMHQLLDQGADPSLCLNVDRLKQKIKKLI
jgi:hypothetical protein